MSGLYLDVKTVGGTMAIAVCYRCQKKIYAGGLKKDPNNQNFYCSECVDILDPWRLPARRAEDISVQHPRPDTDIEPGAH